MGKQFEANPQETAGETIRAADIIEVQEKTELIIRSEYGDAGTIEGVLRGFEITPKNTDYSDTVCITIDVPIEEADAVRSLLVERTAGRVQVS